MKWYTININRLVELLLPRVLRKGVLTGLITSLIFPLNRLQSLFAAYRADVDYKLNHNSQVCFLQAVLNDRFDNVMRRIFIDAAPITTWDGFLWDEETDRPIMLGTYLIQAEMFVGAESLDIIVFIPSAIQLNENDNIKLDALIRNYKLAGKRYTIQEY